MEQRAALFHVLRFVTCAAAALCGAAILVATFDSSSGVTAATAAPAAPARLFPTTRLPDGREVRADRILVGLWSGGGARVVAISGTASIDAALKAYRADARVRYAEPDYVVTAFETPNDPSFASQWGPQKIQAAAAWDVTHGSVARTIAVIDCGIFDEASSRLAPDGLPGHPDIRGKVALRQDFTGSITGTDDRCNHGTHVAGIAAAATNNAIGIAGMGYDTRLLNVKVLDDSGSSSSELIARGINWAADNGANVINMSIGHRGSCAMTEQDAVDYARAHNVVIVAAAGNFGDNAPNSPASCNHVISVAATDPSDALTGFSTYGTWVSLAAPGLNILSLRNTGDYFEASGTSMSAPHVSGVAALVWATSWGTSNQAVVDRLLGTADLISGTGWQTAAGRVNAAAAVGSGPTHPLPPTATPTSSSTPTPSATPTFMPTPAPSDTATPTPTFTPAASSTPTLTPTPTFTPTPSATPTFTPTPSPTSTVSPTPSPSVEPRTVTFDDLADPNRPLVGEYPVALIQWGSGDWYLSGPWGAFVGNSVSFNGSALTSANLSFIGAHRLIQLDAYNGDASPATLTLTCQGQSDVQVTLSARQPQTVATAWTAPCSPVSVSTSNGWSTNFTNLVVQ